MLRPNGADIENILRSLQDLEQQVSDEMSEQDLEKFMVGGLGKLLENMVCCHAFLMVLW